jgi:hypothetical protein
MNDFKPLGLQISESMRAITDQMSIFESPMAAAIRQMQNYANVIPPSLQLSKQLQEQLKFIIPVDFGKVLADALKPYSSFASEFAKTNKLLVDQIKFQIPDIKAPIDSQVLEALRQSSALASLHAVRHSQVGEIRLSEETISRINEISNQVRDGEEISSKAIEAVVQTLARIEDTLNALQSNVKAGEQKLLTIEDIRFLIGLIFTVVFFIIPYAGQKETDKKIEKIEEITQSNSDKLERLIDKLDKVFDLLAKHEKWICSRDTHLRLRPSFKSHIVRKIFQFETVVVENKDSVTHKWIKVKYIDTEDNEVKIGWVSKKYFKKIE